MENEAELYKTVMTHDARKSGMYFQLEDFYLAVKVRVIKGPKESSGYHIAQDVAEELARKLGSTVTVFGEDYDLEDRKFIGYYVIDEVKPSNDIYVRCWEDSLDLY